MQRNYKYIKFSIYYNLKPPSGGLGAVSEGLKPPLGGLGGEHRGGKEGGEYR